MNATGAILIGGKSSRMAPHGPKHTIALDGGRTMLEHVIDAMSIACRSIVIVNSNAQGLPSLGYNLPIITDLRPDTGPLGGIEALLASDIAEQYIVCPCDLPRITAEVFSALLTQADAPSTILQPAGDEPHPLPARIAASALPIVRKMLDQGERAVHRLHARLDAHVVDVQAEWRDLLANVNTPEELARLNKR